MPIYDGTTKVYPSGIGKVYDGNTLVYEPAPTGPRIEELNVTMTDLIQTTAHCCYNGKIYFFGGVKYVSGTGSLIKNIYIYDIATNTITTSTAQLPGNKYEAIAFHYTQNNNEYVAIIGGFNSTSSSATGDYTVYRYDITNNTCTNPGLTYYNNYCAYLSGYYPGGDKIYCIGGCNYNSSSYTVDGQLKFLNPATFSSGRVLPAVSMPTAYRKCGYAYVNGYLYLIGGETKSGSSTVYNTNIYKVDTNGCTTVTLSSGSIPSYFSPKCAAVGTDIYCFTYESNKYYKFDTVNNTFEAVTVSLDFTFSPGANAMVESDGTSIYMFNSLGKGWKFTP